MSAVAPALTDSATFVRRNLRHARRYPSLTLGTLLIPVIILLLFVGILGNTLGAGLGIRARGGGYVDYITPGIIVMTVTANCVATATSVCVDMTSGIVDRLRTMPISRVALLTGHVVSSLIVTVLGTVLVVGLAVLLGFRPHAGPLDWIAALGLVVLMAFALTWPAVLVGLVSKTPESASNAPVLIVFAPFVSSAFIPTAAMPAGARWFAENQPFTPIIETLRGLLLGTPTGDSFWQAIAWCLVFAVAGCLASTAAFNRPRAA
jgi:ABC-2 type transport system permease protein